MKNRRITTIWLLISCFYLSACSSLDFLPGNWSYVQKKHQLQSFETHWIDVVGGIAEDQEIRSFLGPYRLQLDSIMQKPLAVLKEPLELKGGSISSPLANVLADQLRSFASVEKRMKVDVSVLNRGGIRLPMLSDTVKVGTLYELMPFENTLVYLNMSGDELIQLADQLAKVGGEAVSGMRFSIEEDKATNILIGNEEIDPAEKYVVATINYLVEGGGNMPVLWKTNDVEFTPILIRDIYIRSFFRNDSIVPVEDDRIRMIDTPKTD